MGDGAKYIGLSLAMASSIGIGSSFVLTKKGLNAAAESHGFEGEGFTYMKNPIWWTGLVMMVIGEICNFSAYAFAPAILVTPLGALSVLIGAVLGSYFLGEHLGVLGRIGCAICLIGSVVIVLHAPPDEDLDNIDELLNRALQPGFLIYGAIVLTFIVVMIYRVAPKYGKKNPLVFLSICSSAGGISIMAIKGFGIAVKLTLGGNNQFTSPSTYVFAITVAVCIATQMNYFNKALSAFSTNIVNPLYYVTFTTCTLVTSFILFGGMGTTEYVNTISLLCGFLITFTGVYLLNLSREDPDGVNLGIRADGRGKYAEVDGIPIDGITGLQTRLSMQARRSEDGGHVRTGSWSLRSPIAGHRRSQDNLMHSYDLEANSLGDLAEDSDESENGNKRTSFDDTEHKPNGSSNARAVGARKAQGIGVNAAATKSFDKLRRQS